MSLYSMLESVCTIKRPTISRDSHEGVVQTFDQIIVQDVACSVQPASANITVLYAQRNLNVNTTIFFAQNVFAEANDVIEVTDREGILHTFQVMGYRKQIFYRIQAPWSADCQETN